MVPYCRRGEPRGKIAPFVPRNAVWSEATLERGTARNIARWVVLAAGIGVALLYLSGAAGSARVAGVPPTLYTEVRAHRAFTLLCYSVFSLFVSLGLFRWLKVGPRPDRVVLLLMALSVGAMAAPHARKFLLVDRCLDSGARWDAATLSCTHEP